MSSQVPRGWPEAVPPPDSEDFVPSAVKWLLDIVPSDYRNHDIFERFPDALAALARHHTQACVEGARAGYRVVRTELSEYVPPHAIDHVLSTYRVEGKRLAATARSVTLIERALNHTRTRP
jgi:hypothetical protein